MSDTKRLKNQIKEGHLRALKGRPRAPTELGWLEGTFTESDTTDIGNHNDYIVTLRKDNINRHGVQNRTRGSVLSVSKNMLLEASLQSLESLGRQRLCGVHVSSGEHGSPILGKGDFMPMCECVSIYLDIPIFMYALFFVCSRLRLGLGFIH